MTPDWTLEELFAEIAPYCQRETMQPGDITVADLAAKFEMTRERASLKLNEIAQSDPRFTVLIVTHEGKRKKVLRRI
jgi:hypothetical protein